MPLFSSQNRTDSHPKNPNIQPAVYKDITVDSQKIDLRHLITHVEGMKWIIPNYFSQYVTADTEVASQEVTREDVYQQYLRIINLEMRVTEPLSMDQNSTSTEITYSGGSTLFPGITPNVGDMFTADIGDGRTGIFEVTAITRKTILQDSTYAIRYQFISFTTPELFQDLIGKTSKTQTFVKEFISNGKNPYLVDSELEKLRKVQAAINSLPDTYYSLFFNQEYGTLLIPDQPVTMYDPYVVNFFKAITSLEKHPRVTNIRSIHCDTSGSRTYQSIYDALLNLDENVLDTASLKSVRYDARAFKPRPNYGGVRYSGIQEVYYPERDEYLIGNVVGSPLVPSEERVFNRPIPDSQWVTVVDLNESGVMREVPIIHPVTIDDYYVLSGNFYNRVVEQTSLLEIFVNQRLNQTPNDIDKLLQAVDAAETWGRVEQFYYYPILMFLLMYSVGDIN